MYEPWERATDGLGAEVAGPVWGATGQTGRGWRWKHLPRLPDRVFKSQMKLPSKRLHPRRRGRQRGQEVCLSMCVGVCGCVPVSVCVQACVHMWLCACECMCPGVCAHVDVCL